MWIGKITKRVCRNPYQLVFSVNLYFFWVWEQCLPYSRLQAHFILSRISKKNFKTPENNFSSVVHWSFLQILSLFGCNSLGSEDMKSFKSARGSLTISSIDTCFSFFLMMFILCYWVRRAWMENVKGRWELKSSAFCVSSVNIAPSAPGNWPIPSLFFSG